VDPLVLLHVIVAVALLVATLGVGAWGLARARAIASGAVPREAKVFGHLLQLSHTLVFASVLVGAGLMLEGHRSGDPLHVRVYGPFMLVAIVAAYGYRTKDPLLNVRVFAVASLVIFALGLRAFTTGG